MQMPDAERAYLPAAKLHDYLLSETHPDGESKARILRRLGFNDTNADELAEHLLHIARTGSVDEMEPRAYGMMYVIHGEVSGPHGRSVSLRTVWIIEHGGNRPRFVTAYPGQR